MPTQLQVKSQNTKDSQLNVTSKLKLKLNSAKT